MDSRQQSDEPIPPTPAESSVLPEQRHAPVTRPLSPAPPPATGATRRQGTSKLRLVLAVSAGMLALLCLGGAGVAFLLYDQATKPNRSAPDVVVDNYLRAYLVDRNDAQAEQYACGNADGLSQVRALRDETQQRERDFNVSVRVTWSALTRTPVKDGEELVRTDLTIAGFADGQPRSRRSETWEFRVVDDGGWRVCEGRHVA